MNLETLLVQTLKNVYKDIMTFCSKDHEMHLIKSSKLALGQFDSK